MYPALNFLPRDLNLAAENPRTALAYHLLNLLHQEQAAAWQTILSWPYIKAAFISKDRLLLQAIRDLYRLGMRHLCQELNQHQLKPEAKSCLDFLYSWLCFFPYWEWTEDSNPRIEIPQYVNHAWTCLHFEITAIEMTPKQGWSHLWLQKQDRYYTYILHRPGDSAAPTYVIYSGTTYPQGQGFVSHLKSDLQPWHTVGETLMQTGLPQLKSWLQSHQISHGIALGLSLGGSLTLLTALAMPEHIQAGFAFNPAGLYTKPDANSASAPVQILIQGNDKVSQLGFWHPAWQVRHLSCDAAGFNLLDHFRIYAGHASRRYQDWPTEEKNQAHPYLNYFIYKLTRPLIYGFVFWPTYYLIRPLLRLIWDAKYILAFSAVFLLFQLPALTALGSGIFLSSLLQLNPYFQPKYFQNTFFLSSISLMSLLAFALLPPMSAISTLLIGLQILCNGISLYEKLEPGKSFSANP